jgi:hypothetical protein
MRPDIWPLATLIRGLVNPAHRRPNSSIHSALKLTNPTERELFCGSAQDRTVMLGRRLFDVARQHSIRRPSRTLFEISNQEAYSSANPLGEV